MRFGPTFRSGRMRPADGPSNGSATLSRIRSLGDYTIAMLESSFRKRQGQMINASSSIMPIPITSTASATGSYSSQCRLCMYMRRPLLELSAAPTNRSPTSACTRTSNSIAAASVPVARASHRADCLTRSHESGSRSQLSVFGCEFAGEVLVKGLVRAGIS
jgi:hypothetical protein